MCELPITVYWCNFYSTSDWNELFLALNYLLMINFWRYFWLKLSFSSPRLSLSIKLLKYFRLNPYLVNVQSFKPENIGINAPLSWFLSKIWYEASLLLFLWPKSKFGQHFPLFVVLYTPKQGVLPSAFLSIQRYLQIILVWYTRIWCATSFLLFQKVSPQKKNSVWYTMH